MSKAERPEPRVKSDLLVRIWGMDAKGRAFFQNVHATNISSDGALLSGLEHQLTVGDTIGVQLAEKKARFRVIWIIDGGALQKIRAGVQLVEGQTCPWTEELAKAPSVDATASPGTAPGNKRKFTRHKIKYPVDLLDDRGGGAHMQTSATDIGGRGCYVETLIPLPLGTTLQVTFWMESEKITTSGTVRASDPGVGMGIEFTGLSPETQERFQALLDKMDAALTGPPKPQENG